MSKDKKTKTMKEIQGELIEEAKRHPLWPRFCVVYERFSEVHPDKTSVPVILIHNWNLFLSGAAAGREFEIEQETKAKKEGAGEPDAVGDAIPSVGGESGNTVGGNSELPT